MRASAIIGLIAVVFGFIVVVQRGLAGLLDLDYAVVTLIGVLALVQGLRYANDARDAPYRARETDDVELRYEVPTPGDDIDELIAGLRGLSRIEVSRRRDFHARLRRVARETLLARGDYAGSDEAEQALADGTWTDDPVAAWLLGEGVAPPRSVRLRGLLGRDAGFRFAARRAIDAIAAAQRGADVGQTGTDTPNSIGDTAPPTDPDAASLERWRDAATDRDQDTVSERNREQEAGL